VSATGASPLKVALCGGQGRMGRAIQAIAAREDSGFQISGMARRDEDPYEVFAAADVVIDFSDALYSEPLVFSCASAAKPIVIGTTGHDALQREAIAFAASRVGVVFSANFSVGVNALFWLTREAARILGPDFDLEVVEMHHRLKKDAPSGTAKRIAEILAEARDLNCERDAVHGREGYTGERSDREIGMHAIRGGDVVGEHTVLFAGTGERLELTHRASTRETFAAGALRAAAWLVRQPAGLYDMEDVLGLGGTKPG
jgi:4-hydroxy-tetrahydrodipicolinate reductase